jgi:two-component system chemotaxis response regulator CheB
MPNFFTSMLAERLGRQTGRPTFEGKAGDLVQAGTIYIAPGGKHMTVSRKGAVATLALNEEPPEHFCRPAVDPLFRSAAQAFGRELLSVVLTGMGEDGRIGSIAVNEAGGKVIAQDEESSVVWGMPGAVAKSGAAHWVLPLTEIAGQIDKICSLGGTS